MAERLTAEQRSSVLAAIGVGFELDEFAARHPDYPQDDLREFWQRLKTEIDSTPLKPGQYWGVPSEWV
jgi:hypothetical protein